MAKIHINPDAVAPEVAQDTISGIERSNTPGIIPTDLSPWQYVGPLIGNEDNTLLVDDMVPFPEKTDETTDIFDNGKALVGNKRSDSLARYIDNFSEIIVKVPNQFNNGNRVEFATEQQKSSNNNHLLLAADNCETTTLPPTFRGPSVRLGEASTQGQYVVDNYSLPADNHTAIPSSPSYPLPGFPLPKPENLTPNHQYKADVYSLAHRQGFKALKLTCDFPVTTTMTRYGIIRPETPDCRDIVKFVTQTALHEYIKILSDLRSSEFNFSLTTKYLPIPNELPVLDKLSISVEVNANERVFDDKNDISWGFIGWIKRKECVDRVWDIVSRQPFFYDHGRFMEALGAKVNEHGDGGQKIHALVSNFIPNPPSYGTHAFFGGNNGSDLCSGYCGQSGHNEPMDASHGPPHAPASSYDCPGAIFCSHGDALPAAHRAAGYEEDNQAVSV